MSVIRRPVRSINYEFMKKVKDGNLVIALIPCDEWKNSDVFTLRMSINTWLGYIIPQIPPTGLEVLCKLEILDLSGNASSLPEPSVISRLPQLQELYLRRMQLYQFPTGFLCLRRLQILDLSQNNLVTIPEEIKDLTSLMELDLSDNNISALPPELGLLESSLQVLKLDGNPLRSIRRTILDRGTKAILKYLKDKLPSQ